MLRARTRSNRRHARRRPSAPVDHLTSLLRASRALQEVHDPAELGRSICRGAAGIVDAWGALLHLAGPGLLVTATRWGIHPEPARGELAAGSAVDRAFTEGRVLLDDRRAFVPIVGAGGVVGVVSLVGVRPVVPGDVEALHLFGEVAGAALDRCGAADLDRRTAGALAGLRPGDVVVVGSLDTRRTTPAERELLHGRLELHLRRGAWAGDLVGRSGPEEHLVLLRQVREPAESRIGRLVDPWNRAHPDATCSVGAALHLPDRAPLDTLDEARALHARSAELGRGAVLLPPRLVSSSGGASGRG